MCNKQGNMKKHEKQLLYFRHQHEYYIKGMSRGGVEEMLHPALKKPQYQPLEILSTVSGDVRCHDVSMSS